MNLPSAIQKRRTFAIISHPDAGKTTLTEKLLLFGGAIQVAGTVKGRKASRHATSDWMEMEKQRGISVTTAVMQFPYQDRIINLLDTPGHGDFSEDTYRTLTAVDAALMVIDAAKGVEERTIKLLEVCRLRNTPIITFINKMDRDTRDPIEVMDEIEQTLKIRCAPITWPIGMGQSLTGLYHLYDDEVVLYSGDQGSRLPEYDTISGLNNATQDERLGHYRHELADEVELVQGASHQFDEQQFLQGQLSPVFFGSAIRNFGIREFLDHFVEHAPTPQPHEADPRVVEPEEDNFSGFVFKIQANMDPQHRDRIAFLRVCSGCYQKGIKVYHVRRNREMKLDNALTFMAGDRGNTEQAYPGDVIGIHNHGSIQIGDTFTQRKEDLKFTGIPHFAPEMFKRVQLKDPLKMKALQKGLIELSEEGATQVFRPLNSNDLILGAVGALQFDVVAHRLKHEYKVDCDYEGVKVVTARWIFCDDDKMLERFKNKAFDYLAYDGGDYLTYLAPSKVNLNMAMEKWPDITFSATREH